MFLKNVSKQFVLLLGVLGMLLGGCGSVTAPTKQDTPAVANSPATPQMTDVTVAFPYIPNVQFAPYYVAASKGYYKEANINVTFEYMYEDEAVQLVAQGGNRFGFVSGTSVLLARQSGIPVVTVATITQQFPVVFFSKATTPLASVDDLKGQRIGLPGRFGASYYGLLALLYASNMHESDLDLHDIGFNQVQMLTENKVDIAIGYVMNEPVQLRRTGEDVHILRVTDVYPLASDGIITNQKLIDDNPDMVKAFVAATLKGLRDTIDSPDDAFALCLQHIPEAELGDANLQREVLTATIPYWDAEQLGHTDVTVWHKTHDFLHDNNLLTNEVAIDDSVTNAFVP